MKRLLVATLVACGSSTPAPAPLPPAPPPPATTVAAPAPAPPVAAAQRFDDHDAGYAFADPDRRAKLTAALTGMDAAISDEMKKRDLKGLAIGIVIDGELAYAKGFGVVDPETKTVPDADTVYRIGSLSKSFTGLALLTLRDEGVIQLDDPLTKWFPPASGIIYPSRDSRPITLRQLLAHTSGMPRDATDHRNPTEADVAKGLDGVHLDSSPGTQFVYSNTGFGLLSIVVAHAAHSTFRDVVATRIFKPLGMTATTFLREDVPAAHAAPVIGPDDKVVSTQAVLGVEEGAGGIYSSVRDMARYIALQLAAYPPRDGAESPVVRRATIREAHDTGVFSGGGVRARPDAKAGEPTVSLFTNTYGFGWGHFHTCKGDDVIQHSGHIDSFSSIVELEVTRGVGVVVLSNFGDVEGVARGALEQLDKSGALKPYVGHPRASPALDAAMAKLLPIYNQWDEPALKALLSRPIDPVEHEELAGYKALHGTCTAFTIGEVMSPLAAHYAMTCEHGTFDLQIDVTAKGALSGFSGTSTNITVPSDITKLASDAASLIGKWNDQVYERSFADPKVHREVYFNGRKHLHDDFGSCKVKAIAHEVIFWKLDLECTHGALVGNIGVKDSKITSFNVRPPETANTTCPSSDVARPTRRSLRGDRELVDGAGFLDEAANLPLGGRRVRRDRAPGPPTEVPAAAQPALDLEDLAAAHASAPAFLDASIHHLEPAPTERELGRLAGRIGPACVEVRDRAVGPRGPHDLWDRPGEVAVALGVNRRELALSRATPNSSACARIRRSLRSISADGAGPDHAARSHGMIEADLAPVIAITTRTAQHLR